MLRTLLGPARAAHRRRDGAPRRLVAVQRENSLGANHEGSRRGAFAASWSTTRPSPIPKDVHIRDCAFGREGAVGDNQQPSANKPFRRP